MENLLKFRTFLKYFLKYLAIFLRKPYNRKELAEKENFYDFI